LRAGTPTGLAELMRVPKLGVKKIAMIHAMLGVNTLDELEAVCRDGQILECKGITKASAAKLLEGIELARRYSGQVLYAKALELAQPILAELKRCPAVIRAEVAGSLRRCKEIVGDLD